MLVPLAFLTFPKPTVTFESLLADMTNPAVLADLPTQPYASLQASSYNRESTHRDKPGWFADSDGVGFIRQIETAGQKEWVMMEHEGPGCITKFWTPFFYYDFGNRVGPNIRVYLDGNPKPIIDESYIKLVTGQGSIKEPWAKYSARAGNLYLPIPFAKSARITMVGAPAFYFIINYRGYPKATSVETFEPAMLQRSKPALDKAADALRPSPTKLDGVQVVDVPPHGRTLLSLPAGSHAVDEAVFQIEDVDKHPELLRSTVLTGRFDGIESVWCPMGDFFCSADSLHPFETLTRSVRRPNTMISRWLMPYQKRGELAILNKSVQPIKVAIKLSTRPWTWRPSSMHFYARWRPDDIVAGTPFVDWNFIDIEGEGVYVGDAWTVLNVRPNSWWGEGDEKIYVDGAWEKGFPTHFGTGTEDYYGWAGGVYPVLEDEFSAPFLSNVKVGGLDGHTLGYNIVTRARGLDTIPFKRRLRFDMEASFGTDMREKWDLLGYSAVTFFYAKPGAQHNRPPMPASAAKRIMSIDEIRREAERIRKGS